MLNYCKNPTTHRSKARTSIIVCQRSFGDICVSHCRLLSRLVVWPPPTLFFLPCSGENSPGEGDREREQSGFSAKTCGVGGGQVVHSLMPHLHTRHSPRRACHVQPAVPHHAGGETWRVTGMAFALVQRPKHRGCLPDTDYG